MRLRVGDDYDFETLTVPAILLGAPIALSLILYGFTISNITGFTILGIEFLAFLMVPSGALIRNAGRRVAEGLFAQGQPTTVELRAAPVNTDPQRESKRELVSRLTGIQLMTYKKAINHPLEQDSIIISAVDTLRERMRGKDFFLLKRELKSYGYWRNMFGIKKAGLVSSLTGLALALGAFWLNTPGHNIYSWAVNVALCVVCICFILFWIFAVRKQAILNAAERYSRQFYRSLVLLK